MSFNKQARPELFRKLSGETLDLLVVGGGITGASIFRDAALRGMRVGLVEAKDFASATSGRSSKLIHGGLRYLKNLGLRLAWESCHERNLHIRLNKRLVRPMPFLVPLYQERGESRALMRLGMLLYEGLSGFRNYRLHRLISREETLSLAPALPADSSCLPSLRPVVSVRTERPASRSWDATRSRSAWSSPVPSTATSGG